MTARFLYAIPKDFGKRLLRDSKDIEPLCQANYENKIRDIMAIPRNEGELYELRFSEAATELLVVYNDDGIQERIGEDLACIPKASKRVIGQTIRLAGILHLMEHGSGAVEKREISAETVKKAIRLTDYFLEHTKAAHKTVEDSEEVQNLKYVWEKCRALKKPVVPHDVLRESCRGRLRTNEEQRPYIGGLIEKGYLRELPADKKEKGKDGRPGQCVTGSIRFYMMRYWVKKILLSQNCIPKSRKKRRWRRLRRYRKVKPAVYFSDV